MISGFVPCRTPLPFTARVTRAALYGAQVFLSFFLMLIFMTYNVSHRSNFRIHSVRGI